MFEFFESQRKQTSTVHYIPLNDDERSRFKDLSLSVTTSNGNFTEYLFNNSTYVYGRLSPSDVPIPLFKVKVDL